MKTHIENGTTCVEFDRETSVSFLQFIRLFPVQADYLDQYKRIVINTGFSRGYVAYRKIAEGLWYLRFDQSFHTPTEIRLGRTTGAGFYELEYFISEDRFVFQRTQDDYFPLNQCTVFGCSTYDKVWEIEKGSHLISLKFVFTKEFLSENFYIADPALKNTAINKILQKERPYYKRPIHSDELCLIGELEELFNRKEPYLLQTIVIKAKVLQLICRYFDLQVSGTGSLEYGLESFSEAIKLMKEHMEEGFPGLSSLASVCHVSVPTFKRKFKVLFSATPEYYFRQMQMEQAEAMLRYPGTTVREVAASLGYVDIGSFASTFKKMKGYFPSSLKNASSRIV